MKTLKVKVDFDELREIVALGVRRASIFMGIGTNAARIDPPISHVLNDQASLTFVDSNFTEENSREFVQEFECWIIANGFRELVETFSHFLSTVYGIYYFFEHTETTMGDINKANRQFEYKGIEDQMDILTGLLNLDGRFSPMFASLNQARNCMAHRRGVVGLKDISEPDQPFVLLWRTKTAVLEDEHGTDIFRNIGDGIRVEKGRRISIVEVERSKNFDMGEPIRLSRLDLSEICFGVTIAMEYVRTCLIEFGRCEGHTIVEKVEVKT